MISNMEFTIVDLSQDVAADKTFTTVNNNSNNTHQKYDAQDAISFITQYDKKGTDDVKSQNGREGMSVTLQNVSYSVQAKDEEKSNFIFTSKKDKVLLNDITVSFIPGRLVALMGSSGAGKSTLMDLVAGRKTQGKVFGSMLFDGIERPAYFRRVAGYVEQDDILIPTLTVRETLMYAAELRLPASQVTQEEKAARVTKILHELGLTHIADSLVGDTMTRGVSGGERKRVSIGVELVTNPQILFLDEPTSGLDSATTLDVVRVLKQLSRAGRTIVCTIHQPSASAFALFDQLVLLHKGRIAYNGAANEAETYFRSLGFNSTETVGFNPADFIVSVVGGGRTTNSARLENNNGSQTSSSDDHYDDGDKTVTGNFELSLADEWTKTSMFNARFTSAAQHVFDQQNMQRQRATTKPSTSDIFVCKDLPSANTFFHELKTLMSRSWRVNTRDRNYLMVHLFKNIVVALILLSIYYNVNDDSSVSTTNGVPVNVNALALLFTSIMMWSFGCMAFLAPLIQERAIFYRERQAAAYGVLPYYLQRIIIEIPFSIITVTIFTVIVWFGCGYPSDAAKFFIAWFVILLTNECAIAYAQTIAAISPTMEVATSVTPIVMNVFMLFSGFLLTTSKIPVYWRYTVRYISFVAYAFAAIGNSTFQGTKNEAVIKLYELNEYSVWTNIGSLIAMMLMWRILGLIAIKYVRFQKR